MEVRDLTIDWLLEDNNYNIRYLTLKYILNYPETHAEVIKAKEQSYRSGAIGKILDTMQPDGFWFKPGPGYSPKYQSSVWSLMTLAQIGAHISSDTRVQKACNYFLDNNLTDDGKFSVDGCSSGTIDCLQGNMCRTLLDLGCRDSRLEMAHDWLARSVTGDGVDRYYRYKSGPQFRCGFNNNFPCAWGAIKVLGALCKIPEHQRTPQMRKAIEIGTNFLLNVDPATALYPTKDNSKPSRNWWKLSFPVFYITDILQNLEVLMSLGYGNDSRLSHTINLIMQKQNSEGSWNLEYDYHTGINFGTKNKPNKWVTYRVLKVLRHIELPEKFE